MPGDNMREAASKDREKCRPTLLLNSSMSERRIFVLAPKVNREISWVMLLGKFTTAVAFTPSRLNVIDVICDANTMRVVNGICDFYNANSTIDRDKLNMMRQNRGLFIFQFFNRKLLL